MATPEPLALLAALALVALIGWFDYATGLEVDATGLYALPIVLTVWAAGRRLGLAIALLCMVTWWAAQVGSEPYRTGWGFRLALATAGSYLAILAIAAAAVKGQWELGRGRAQTTAHRAGAARRVVPDSGWDRRAERDAFEKPDRQIRKFVP
jgi:hypothetical protein